MLEVRSDSTRSRFSSPGTAKISLTPSASNARTNRSDALIVMDCELVMVISSSIQQLLLTDILAEYLCRDTVRPSEQTCHPIA